MKIKNSLQWHYLLFKPLVTWGYHIDQCRYITFPSSQKVLWDSAVLALLLVLLIFSQYKQTPVNLIAAFVKITLSPLLSGVVFVIVKSPHVHEWVLTHFPTSLFVSL